MIATYAPMFLMLAVAALVAGAFFVGATFLGGKLKVTPEKMKPFECGSESSGGNHLKLSVKFYLTAILFVVFDIEAVFVYPWAVSFHQLGLYGLIEMVLFILILLAGYFYLLKKRALEWE